MDNYDEWALRALQILPGVWAPGFVSEQAAWELTEQVKRMVRQVARLVGDKERDAILQLGNLYDGDECEELREAIRARGVVKHDI